MITILKMSNGRLGSLFIFRVRCKLIGIQVSQHLFRFFVFLFIHSIGGGRGKRAFSSESKRASPSYSSFSSSSFDRYNAEGGENSMSVLLSDWQDWYTGGARATRNLIRKFPFKSNRCEHKNKTSCLALCFANLISFFLYLDHGCWIFLQEK